MAIYPILALDGRKFAPCSPFVLSRQSSQAIVVLLEITPLFIPRVYFTPTACTQMAMRANIFYHFFAMSGTTLQNI